jgi:hypothetical protein
MLSDADLLAVLRIREATREQKEEKITAVPSGDVANGTATPKATPKKQKTGGGASSSSAPTVSAVSASPASSHVSSVAMASDAAIESDKDDDMSVEGADE